jgi:hypothetical protein
MRVRLAAAAAGCVLIAAAIFAFSVSSHPVIAGTNGVEPISPTVSIPGGAQSCQRISHVPRGADRLELLVTFLEGGADHLHVKIADPRGLASAGDLKPLTPGERLIQLKPRTRAARRATLCLTNPGRGRIWIGGDKKRAPGQPKGPKGDTQNVASAIFVRPGSSSWIAQTGAIADRYANSRTGVTGGWSLWLAVLFAVAAALVGIWSVVRLPGRPT